MSNERSPIPMGATAEYTAPSQVTLTSEQLTDPFVGEQIKTNPGAMRTAQQVAIDIENALNPQSAQARPAPVEQATGKQGEALESEAEKEIRQKAYDDSVHKQWDAGEIDGVHAAAKEDAQKAVDTHRAEVDEDIVRHREEAAAKAARRERGEAFDLSRARDDWPTTRHALDKMYEEAELTGDMSEFDSHFERLRQGERESYTRYRDEVEAQAEASLQAARKEGEEREQRLAAERGTTAGTEHEGHDHAEHDHDHGSKKPAIDDTQEIPVITDKKPKDGKKNPYAAPATGDPKPDEKPEKTPTGLVAKAEKLHKGAVSEFVGGMFGDIIVKDTAQVFRLNKKIGWKTAGKLAAAFIAGAATRVTLDILTGWSHGAVSATAGAVTSVALGKRHYDGSAEATRARKAGRAAGLLARGAVLGYLGGEVAGMFHGGDVNAAGGQVDVDANPPDVESFDGFTTDEIGKWDGKYDADTNYYNGTGYNAIAHSMADAYHDATGNDLNWQDLQKETPGFEGAYHDFVGKVLEANNLTWEDAKTMPDSATLEVPPEAIKEFGDSLGQITEGKLGAADFGWTETTAETAQAAPVTPDALAEQTTAEAQQYVAGLDAATKAQLLTEFTSGNIGEGTVQQLNQNYLTWLSANHPQEYGLYQAMSEAQQVEYQRLLQEALIKDLTTV